MVANSTKNIDLSRVLASAQLPALPQSAIRILEVSKDPKNGPAEFALPIEADPGLTGQVLKFVNSSYFGFSREISSIKLAITLVGIRTIKNFTLWSAVFSLMPNPRCGPFDPKCLWQDSLRRALIARQLGRLLGAKEADECFAAGLLQDMAVPMLAKEFPEQYAKMLEERDSGRNRLSVLETETFGWNHANAAAEMARRWNLPEDLVAPLEEHADIKQVIDSPTADPQVKAVALSALLPAAVDPLWLEREAFEELYLRLLPAGAPPIGKLLQQVDNDFVEFAPVLAMTTPAKSLVATYQESLAAQQAGV